jgi:two-component system response regulator LytT
MNVLIVEDEPRAANRLARLIHELQPEINIVAKTPSVASTLDWLHQNASPDLIFMDVRLEDGDSFEILSQSKTDSPIIFCTAYSDYALQAFAVNSIDYLLKPIVRNDLSRALDKYRRFSGYRMSSGNWPDFPVEGEFETRPPTYRQQFLVALAGKFTPVRTVNVIAAGSFLKGSQLVDRNGRHWTLDDSLVEIEKGLNPREFCRISRQWLVRLSSIASLQRNDKAYFVLLTGKNHLLKVSRTRVKALKEQLQ